MPISKTPEIEQFPVWSEDQGDNPVTRYLPIPTAANVKATKLFGIPLVSAFTQETMSDDTITEFIASAISEIEHTLDLYITPVKFKEKHDYRRHEFTWNYNFLKVNHPNVLNVEKLELTFSNAPEYGFVDFPLEHVHVMPQEGTIQLVPAFGTSLSGFLLSAFSGTQFHALRSVAINEFPGGVRVTYTSGFAEDKVPALLVELIRVKAALKVLSGLGPILFPHNSVSIGIDGVSQSTGNSGPQFLATRLADLEKEEQKLLDAAKGYYQRSFLHDML
ncbi:hypothetical protein KY315_04055 [Candidatus Woesearchaeota archaeon]|nr:hypothetical protein [Candidatus Woesearchaeota archaeon]